MSSTIRSVDLDTFVQRLERRTYEYLRESTRQNFSVGHPSDFIMPIFKYCLYAVKELFEGEPEVDVNSFRKMFRFCVTNLIQVIARTEQIVENEIIPQIVEDLRKMSELKLRAQAEIPAAAQA